MVASKAKSLARGWSEAPLGELVDITIGKTPSRKRTEYWGGQSKWATISDMIYGQALTDTSECITRKAINDTNPRLVKKGTLLFSFKLTIGKMAFAGCDLYTNEAIAALVPKDDRIDTRFLFYSLRVADLTRNAGEAAKGRTLNTKTLPLIRVSIPANPGEQHRVVEAIESLTDRAQKGARLSGDAEGELDGLLRTAYRRLEDGATYRPLETVADLVRRKIVAQPNKKYEEMGVRSFGKGTFAKPVLTGRQIGSKRIYWIHDGDLVFNNVFAWEGAIAVAQPEDHGRVGSHRFITYVPHEGKATSEFLCQHFLSERGLEDIRAASPGSAGRNRTLGLKKLAKIKVPVPDYGEQLRFVELMKRRRSIYREAGVIAKELGMFEGAVIAKAFRGEL